MQKKIKILRIITRLNIGGPSIHVSLLTKGLDPAQFESVLISGNVSDLEGDMSYVARNLGIKPVILPSLRREINLFQDIKTLFRVLKILNEERPDIVHTHTAKAGTLGRIAVFIHNRFRKKKVLVIHTFHGHVLHGYFSRLKSQMFIWAERLQAKATDAIIVISKSQKNELSRKYRIAPEEKFRTVRLGFDLRAFSSTEDLKGQFRKRIGVTPNVVLIGIVGRLVAIKNHRMFLDAAKLFIEENPDVQVKFVIIGDGELRQELISHSAANGLSDHVIFCGWIRKLPQAYADLDILVLTSINEGTPVSIIEAMASSVPVISTDAGGVRDLLGSPRTGFSDDAFEICQRGVMCRQNDANGLAKGIRFILVNTRFRQEISHSARVVAVRDYSELRLFREIESIYLDLLRDRSLSKTILEKAAVSPPQPSAPLKVLQVYKDYYPPVVGGVEGHINLLANGLKDRGIQVEVLVSNTHAKLETEYINGIRVVKVPQLGRFASAPLNASLSIWVRRLGKDADVIHFHFPNPTGEIASLLAGVGNKIVVTYHSDIVRQARLAKLYSPFLHRFLKGSDVIIATSPNYVHSSEVLHQFRDKCTVIPFGIDMDRFSPDSNTLRQVASIRETYEGPLALFIGKFRYYKGLYVLLEAMKTVQGSLLLVGVGPMESDLKKQVASDNELKDKVFFLGELSDQDIVSHLHACDVFVFPSIFRSEAFGIVLLEAMACGKPLISTELGTGTSFVNQHHETGLVVSPNDVEALAEAINYLFANPEVRKRFGKAARARVEKYFCLDRMVEDVIRTYQEIQN
ncbi:MAG: glycosyltransferase [Deltaproteobacteria bacterium]|nr:glycosyltransferase [Deltaproteobacteria bacterium]